MKSILNSKTFLIALSIALFLSLMLGFSYAFFVSSDSQTNVASTACFELSYSSSNDITLNSVIPISEVEASNLTPYTFTIKNICKEASSYDVTIEDLNNSDMDLSAIRYKLDDEESNILGSITPNQNKVLTTSKTSRTIASGMLLYNEQKTYNLKLWIDENATVSQSANKVFESKVVVVSTMDKNPYYTITLNKNNGEDNSSVSVVKGRNIGSMDIPMLYGYTFKCWCTDSNLENEVDDSYIPLGNETLYAKYFPTQYNITYNLDDGKLSNPVSSYNIESNSFTLPTPTKAGYTFEGWTGSNGSALNKNVTISKGTTGDLTYNAHWGYYVEIKGSGYNQTSGERYINIAGVKANNTQARGFTYVKFNRVTGKVIATASLDTYADDSARNTLASVINNSTTDEFIAIFSQDATGYNTTLKNALFNAGILNTRSFYAETAGRYPTAIFVGKGLNTSQAGLVESLSEAYAPNAHLKIYVKDGVPQRQRYSISYNLVGGSFPSAYQSSYDGSSAITLTNPTRSGYAFLGWVGSNGSTPQSSVTIPSGSSGDKSYSAIWKSPYTLTNMIKNGSFESGSTNWSLSGANVVSGGYNGSYSLRFDPGGISMSSQTLSQSAPTLNHKYYFSVMFKSASNYTKSDSRYEWYYTDANNATMFVHKNTASASWQRNSTIGVVTANTYLGYQWNIRNFVRESNIYTYADSLLLIDLTAAFGAGNEPSKEWCDSNINYFDTTATVYYNVIYKK